MGYDHERKQNSRSIGSADSNDSAASQQLSNSTDVGNEQTNAGGKEPSEAQIEAYLLKHGLPPLLTQHDLPWEEPPPFRKENYNVKPEPDRLDHFAITADFAQQQPTSKVLERRLKYRPRLWFNCLPTDQRFFLFTFYGPQQLGPFDVDTGSDDQIVLNVPDELWKTNDAEELKKFLRYIQRHPWDTIFKSGNLEKWGFMCFGGYPTMTAVYDKISEIRARNPHAVSFRIRCLDLSSGKCVQLPPPNDGSIKTSHINQFHEQIMTKHFDKTIQEFRESEQRVEHDLQDLQRRNTVTENYNFKLEEQARKLVGITKSEIQQRRRRARDTFCNLLDALDPKEAAKPRPTDINNQTIIDQIQSDSKNQYRNIKSLTPDQVKDYIDNYTDLTTLPSGFKIIYRRLMHDGKEYLIRSLQAIEPADQSDTAQAADTETKVVAVGVSS